ncbi:helix-turn-helix domain-containing protein [Peptoniphilus raoultii]
MLRRKGFKIKEISEKLDVSMKSISNWLKYYR